MPKINLPKFTFINGPPGSGKSTLAELLVKNDGTLYRESFANPIRDMVYAVFFPDEGPISFTFDLRDGETKKKRLPSHIMHPDADNSRHLISNRDVMMSFSEEWMKPQFGDDVFGRLALARCKEQEDFYDRFVFDDSGFAGEAEYIIEQEGASNCLLIRLYRDGTSFNGDSRSHIQLRPDVQYLDIQNDSSIEELFATLQLHFGTL